MITFDYVVHKLYCDRTEWECYSKTPDSVIEEVNALVYAVITTNTEPIIAQKIIYDTIYANETYRKYGFRDSEGDQCTTNIINEYYGSDIDRWANRSLIAEHKDEKWIHNVTPQNNTQETKPMGLTQQSYARLAEALADEVSCYIAEDDRFREVILKLIPEAIQSKLGLVDAEVIGELTAHLAPKMVLVGMED
jgi:hypothetical protein